MPLCLRSRLTTGGHPSCAEVPHSVRPYLTTGGRGSHAEMPSDLRPHLTAGGRGNCAEMPKSHRPHLILAPLDHRIMPNTERANGKGHTDHAAMPSSRHPSQPFNRGPMNLRRDALGATPPPYNRGPSIDRRNAMHSTPPPYNREPRK